MSVFSIPLKQFSIFNANAKRLLKANLMFGLLIPFYVIFSNTFIFGSANGDITFNILYSALHFWGNPIGFIMNGFLLRKVHVKSLFIAGMLLIIINMGFMLFLPPEFFTKTAILGFGVVSGIGSGMYWSARTYLTVVSTTDDNRNFFSGLDFMFLIAGGIVTPFIIGNFIGLSTEWGVFTRAQAYQVTLLFALAMVLLAAYFVVRGNFGTVTVSRFLYYRFEPSWWHARGMVFVMGLFHGAYLSLPAILIMTYVGNEKAVGIVDSIAHLVALIAIYLVSSRIAPGQRTRVMLAGSILLLAGTATFTGLLNQWAAAATITMVATFYLTDPTINFPYRASFMRAIDRSRAIEQRNQFTYVVDIEQFNALGRLVSIGIFYALLQMVALKQALTFYLLFIAASQFANIYFSKRINNP